MQTFCIPKVWRFSQRSRTKYHLLKGGSDQVYASPVCQVMESSPKLSSPTLPARIGPYLALADLGLVSCNPGSEQQSFLSVLFDLLLQKLENMADVQFLFPHRASWTGFWACTRYFCGLKYPLLPKACLCPPWTSLWHASGAEDRLCISRDSMGPSWITTLLGVNKVME